MSSSSLSFRRWHSRSPYPPPLRKCDDGSAAVEKTEQKKKREERIIGTDGWRRSGSSIVATFENSSSLSSLFSDSESESDSSTFPVTSATSKASALADLTTLTSSFRGLSGTDWSSPFPLYDQRCSISEAQFWKHRAIYRKAMINEARIWFRVSGLRQEMKPQQQNVYAMQPPCGVSLRDEETGRPRWPNRNVFLFASIGAAIGVANFFLFSNLWLTHDGGSFLISYPIAKLLSGLTFLTLEFALGQAFQGSPVVAFNSISKRASGIGMAVMFISFVTICYYIVIVANSLKCAMLCFSEPLPWVLTAEDYKRCSGVRTPNECLYLNDTEKCEYCEWEEYEIPQYEFAIPQTHLEGKCKPSSLFKAFMYFETKLSQGMFQDWRTSICVFLAVLTVFLSSFRGMRSLTYVVDFIVIAPIIIIILLMVNVFVVIKSFHGVYVFMSSMNLSVLWENPDVWIVSFSQSFFSLSLFSGTMMSFASYNPRKQNVFVDCIIVIMADLLMSFFCGIVAFWITENFSLVEELQVLYQGKRRYLFTMKIMTSIYAVGLSTLPGAQILCLFFFLAFYILGIGSIVGFLEGLVCVFVDSYGFGSVRREVIVSICCGLCFLGAYPFVGVNGQHYIDSVSFALWTFGATFVALFYVIFIGWIDGWSVQVQYVGKAAAIAYGITYGGMMVAITLAVVYWRWTQSFSVYIFTCILFYLSAGVITSICLCDRRKTKRFRDVCWWLILGNVELFRAYLNTSISKDGKWYHPIPIWWSFCIKYFFLIPSMLWGTLTRWIEFEKISLTSTTFLFAMAIGSIPVFLIFIGLLFPNCFFYFSSSPKQPVVFPNIVKMRNELSEREVKQNILTSMFLEYIPLPCLTIVF